MEIIYVIQFLFYSTLWVVVCGFGLYISLKYVAPKIMDYYIFKEDNKNKKVKK